VSRSAKATLGHVREDHDITGSPYEQTRAIIARHLCEWIAGHSAPLAHMLIDADEIMEELAEAGIQFVDRALFDDAVSVGLAGPSPETVAAYERLAARLMGGADVGRTEGEDVRTRIRPSAQESPSSSSS
jgi:hypothetical protein